MDYEGAILERLDDLCVMFEEQHGRRPTDYEMSKLYEEANELVDRDLCAAGDFLRKEAKGE